MIKRKAAILVIAVTLFVSGIASAHHPSGGVGLGQAGPIRTTSATTLPGGMFSIALQAEYIPLDSFSDSELLGFSGRGEDAHTADSVFHAILGIGYGITDNLTVSLNIPYEEVHNIREAHGDEPEEIHRHGDAKGFGDMTIMAQYRFLKTDDRLEAAVLGGLRMPTGQTNIQDIHGETFEAEFLPGSGAWSPVFGLAATKKLGRVSFDASLQYLIKNVGTQSTNLGDIFNYNAAVSYRVLHSDIAWDFILEANGEWKEKQKTRGDWDPNSGGHSLFISPGTRIVLSKKMSAFLSVGFPVMQDLNGNQDDIKYKGLFGISLSL